MCSLSVAALMDLWMVRVMRLPCLDTCGMALQVIQREALVDAPNGLLEKNIDLDILQVEEAALSLDALM